MNGRDLLFTLKEECFKIGHFNKIKENYRILQESLIEFEVSNYFSQINKNSVGALTFELCFLNVEFIHDITISPSVCVHSVVKINSISKLCIETGPDGIVRFNVYGQGDGIVLTYSLKQERFEEINKFKNELLKIISMKI